MERIYRPLPATHESSDIDCCLVVSTIDLCLIIKGNLN